MPASAVKQEAVNVWDVRAEGSDEEMAGEGLARMEAYMKELGVVMHLRERGVTESMIDTGRQPMGLSWSAMRKVLEDENICDSLKGRVQYFVTRYRESHDQEGRVAVRLDGNEIFKSNFYDGEIKRHEAWSEIDASKGRHTDYSECGEQIELEALNKGGFDRFAFYNAFHTLNLQSKGNSRRLVCSRQFRIVSVSKPRSPTRAEAAAGV